MKNTQTHITKAEQQAPKVCGVKSAHIHQSQHQMDQTSGSEKEARCANVTGGSRDMTLTIERCHDNLERWLDGLRDDPRDHPEYQEQQINLFEVTYDQPG